MASNSKNVLTILILTTLLLLTTGFTVAAPLDQYTVEGDTVYSNTTSAYLSATPHTLKTDGTVDITVKSKTYDGLINAVFGFNTTTVTPTRLELYDNTTGSWTDISTSFTPHEHDFNDKNLWYSAQDVSITSGQEYKLKLHLDINENTSGKYDFAVYPSSYGLDVTSAYDAGALMYLDPWWDLTDNTLYKELSTTNAVGQPTISKPVALKIVDGDAATTGTGDIVIDWTYIDGQEDITVFDDTGNVADYAFESFDATSNTATLWVYDSWTRDGTSQLNVSYANGTTDQSTTVETVFDQETGLVARYLMNEELGDMFDATSNNNDGTLNGGVTHGASGVVDGAYSFDGADDSVITNNFFGITGSQDRTVSLWMKTSYTSDMNYLYSVGDSLINGQQWELWINNDGTIQLAVSGGNRIWNANIRDGNWHHISIVLNGTSTSDLTAYLDGVEATISSTNAQSIDTEQDYFHIGVRSSDPNDRFTGDIDDVAIYNTALSAEEVEALYDSTKPSPDFFTQGAENEVPSSFTPPVTTTKTPSDITDTSATLNGNVTPNDAIGQEVNAYYNISSDGGASWTKTAIQVINLSTQTEYSTTVSGLTDNTTYDNKFCIDYTDDNATSKTTCGSLVSFTTQVTPPYNIETATYNSEYGAPSCNLAVDGCLAPSSLINNTQTAYENNSPNTIDTCNAENTVDATWNPPLGIHNITVTSDTGNLSETTTVTVTAVVNAPYASSANLFYTSDNPINSTVSWALEQNYALVSGYQTISGTVTLDSTSDIHTVRIAQSAGTFDTVGTPECAEVDNDDVVFTTESGVVYTYTPPSMTTPQELNITNSSVIVRSNLTQNSNSGELVTVTIDYGTTSGSYTEVLTTGVSPSSNYTLDLLLEGLSSNTTYYYEYCYNYDDNTGTLVQECFTEQSFTTLSDDEYTPPPQTDEDAIDELFEEMLGGSSFAKTLVGFFLVLSILFIGVKVFGENNMQLGTYGIMTLVFVGTVIATIFGLFPVYILLLIILGGILLAVVKGMLFNGNNGGD